MQPELIEGLDKALANIDPSKVTSQLILKAFEHAPGLVAQLQQVLDRNTDASASILAHTIQHPLDGTASGRLLVMSSYILRICLINSAIEMSTYLKPSSCPASDV